jgi:hypothetical protein
LPLPGSAHGSVPDGSRGFSPKSTEPTFIRTSRPAPASTARTHTAAGSPACPPRRARPARRRPPREPATQRGSRRARSCPSHGGCARAETSRTGRAGVIGRVRLARLRSARCERRSSAPVPSWPGSRSGRAAAAGVIVPRRGPSWTTRTCKFEVESTFAAGYPFHIAVGFVAVVAGPAGTFSELCLVVRDDSGGRARAVRVPGFHRELGLWVALR